jgi:Ca2+-binding EF-hand superfamily protein
MTQQQHRIETERSVDPAAVDPATQERTSELTAALRASSFQEGTDLLKPEDTLLGDLFRRIDTSGDKGIDRDEVIAHLKLVGIKGGFLGMVHSKVSDEFLEKLDANGDERVTMDEFGAVAQQLLPSDLFDEAGNVQGDKLEGFLNRLDVDGSAGIDSAEMYQGTLEGLPEGTAHAKTIADVARKLAIDALDTDASGEINLEELQNAADAVASARAAGGD